MTFSEMGLKTELLTAIEALGFEEPTPVQRETIPFVLAKKNDVVVLSQTGTGKTGAFGLPILELIEEDYAQTQALILCPTRELCIQITHDIKRFSVNMPSIRTLALYGGADIRPQLDGLDQGAQIIVATPGRLRDLMRTRKANLSALQQIVLDEADEMLNMGFEEDLNAILGQAPEKAQRLLFSATMPQRVTRMMHNYMFEPHEITIGERNTLSELVEHQYILAHAKERYAALRRLIDFTPDMYAIIFCRTKTDTQLIADRLCTDGYTTEALHGDLTQFERDDVMMHFRKHETKLLVATDVAARGLDIHDLTHVVHYSIPDEQNTYTHRSGRTGRAGKNGTAISIINNREKFKLERIETVLDKTIDARPIPTNEELIKIVTSPEALNYYRTTPDLLTTPEKMKQRTPGETKITGKEARAAHVPRDMTVGMIEMVLNIGQRNELTEEGLKELLTIEELGGAIELGRINIVQMQTYVEVPYAVSVKLINYFAENKPEFAGRKTSIALAGNAKPAAAPKADGKNRPKKRY